MKRSGEKKPQPSASSGPGRAPPAKPGRSGANAETIGRFVQNLARLEGGAGEGRKARETTR
ncbi:hypothetical protein [Bosea lathyri]|uniref:Uncharacterized protein n=1 Tax=Bosea lathyri TaxID=1036778 RepID=A0A1H5U1P5_9HYPH|nr:hypothetical protein [Bosea lathyri]SEF68930.1 hypothetical protein SAMN04488115_101858 [Bosea lathyri]